MGKDWMLLVMDTTGKKTENPLYSEDIDQQLDLLLGEVGNLDKEKTQVVSSKAVAQIVDKIAQGRHQTRIHLSRAIEEFITSWKPGDSLLQLRHAILAGLGLLNSTTERGIKSITRQIDELLRAPSKDGAHSDHLLIVDAIAQFYWVYPNDFEFKYLEELFRFCEPSSFQMRGALAAIMLGLNQNTPGRLRLNEVVDVLFASDDVDTINDTEKSRIVSNIVKALPTKYWSQHLYKLDDPQNNVLHTCRGRLAFLRYFLLSDPPLLAIFSVEDVTYIVRPGDLLREFEEGQSVRVAIQSCAARLREPIQLGSFLDIDSEYQDLLRFAMERSNAWQRRVLTAKVISFADHQHKNKESSR